MCVCVCGGGGGGGGGGWHAHRSPRRACFTIIFPHICLYFPKESPPPQAKIPVLNRHFTNYLAPSHSSNQHCVSKIIIQVITNCLPFIMVRTCIGQADGTSHYFKKNFLHASVLYIYKELKHGVINCK